MKIYDLRNLPNKEGFEFIGVKADTNELVNCKVCKDKDGFHYVTNVNTQERCFKKLIGWALK